MKTLILTLGLAILTITGAWAQEEAYFGIHYNAVSREKANKLEFKKPYGAYITQVVKNSSAKENGFQPFDYIYQVDERKFDDHYDFHDIMENYAEGDKATIYYVRDGQELSKQVVFGNEEDAESRHRDRNADPFLGVEQNHWKPSKDMGVRVDVVDNSTAMAMGLADDDLITKIDGYPIVDWHDLGAAIDAREVGDPITITYQRGSKMTTVTSPIKSLGATKDGQNHGSYQYSYSYDRGSWDDHDNENEEEDEEEMEATEEVVPEKANVADMVVDMIDLTFEEAEEMEESFGIDMPVVQNLSIEALNLFPNPTMGMFNLSFELPNEGTVAIRIFNASGRLIYSNDLVAFSGPFNDQIDLGNQPAGTYFVMIQQGDNSVSQRLVIARS